LLVRQAAIIICWNGHHSSRFNDLTS
jgi:hypothetical protein